MWDALGVSMAYLAGAILLIIIVYFVVRAASVAFFKTRVEHLQQIRKLKEGEDDGERL